MTTLNNNGSAAPTEGADGQQIWNPSVGITVPVNYNKRESYGGIIAALVDQNARAGGYIHSYPENFAGIIAAIQDLNVTGDKPGSHVGELPDGGQIIIDPNTGNPIYIEGPTTVNGRLWFDTRQGRLFVHVDGHWYQTNGADGIPIVTNNNQTPPSPEALVPGTFWWVRDTGDLYIFDGYYLLPDGSTTEDPTAGGDPAWRLVVDADQGTFQTTSTLPLAAIGPRVTSLENLTYLPNVDLSEGTMVVQKDYNEWIFQSLVALDLGLAHLHPVVVSTEPPEFPAVGQLWYDTNALELSIWYEDDDTAQWVPTAAAYNYDEKLKTLSTQLSNETQAREQTTVSLEQELLGVRNDLELRIYDFFSDLAEVQSQLDAVPVIDLEPYATSADLTAVRTVLETRLSELENAAPDFSLLMSREDIEAELNAIKLEQQDLATAAALNEVEASIPDVTSFVTQDDIDASIAGITVEYLPRTGGTLTGSFVVEKEDIALPGFDFSTASWHSKHAFKLLAQGPSAEATTFGTTDEPWELAWEFKGNEDFCWSHANTGKQLSVSKDGVACKDLIIADFAQNNDQGRTVLNTIDVKDRLQRYQVAFEHLRQGVSNATDFDSLKANILSALTNV